MNQEGVRNKPKKILIKQSTTLTDTRLPEKPRSPIEIQQTHQLLSDNQGSGVYQAMGEYGGQKFYEVSDNLSRHQIKTVEVSISQDDGHFQTDSIY